jgi:uncharacterized NAD-dependent epimerase/dehydratase family protein
MMENSADGNAIVYCEGAYGTPNGKTAHGLVRYTHRYRVLGVVDSEHTGEDAGAVLGDEPRSIPIHRDLRSAMAASEKSGRSATHFVIGLAPDGGRLGKDARQAVVKAIEAGLNVDCGLHDFLSEDSEIAALAANHGATIRDVRKPPPREQLHFFSGKIEEVTSLKIAMLGTDSAVGKRTTAWILVDALRFAGRTAEMIGTGQTAWMQGVRYGIVLDSLINDFVAGEIEHAVWSAWKEIRPDVIIIEGQGSLMNPAYPGGFEILAAGRPDAVILQHAPARIDYDGFPGYPIHPLDLQIRAVELLSGKPVIAITINHEGLTEEEIPAVCREIHDKTGLPTADVLRSGADVVVAAITERLPGL